VLASVILLPAALSAIFTDLEQQFAQAQRRNAEELRQYTWKSRTELRKGGETKSVQLALMRYDIYGALQKTPIGGTAQPQLPSRGLRGRVAQKKKDDVIETLTELEQLARSYSELPPPVMQRFMATAFVTPEVRPQQQLIQARGKDVLQPGDSVSF